MPFTLDFVCIKIEVLLHRPHFCFWVFYTFSGFCIVKHYFADKIYPLVLVFFYFISCYVLYRQELQRILSDLSVRIRVDEEDLRKSKRRMEEITQKLLHGLRREHGIVRNFEYTGSSYEGTKILRADEFDVMVLLNGNTDGGLEVRTLTPGYAALQPVNPSATIYSEFLAGGTRFLCPDRVRRRFTGMVQTQLNKLNFPVPLTLAAHGPAVMLRIQDAHHIIEVDLVPTFVVNGQYYVAKPYKSYADNPERNIKGVSTSLCWRQSTSLKEKGMLQGIDSDQGCRRKCLKILKYIRTKDATLSCLTSFHFKNLVLRHAAEGAWRDANMAERFLGLLQSLYTCLDAGNLNHFFIPQVNLLDGYGADVIQNLKGRARRLTSSDQAIRQLLQ